MQRQTAVTVQLASKQLPLFALVIQQKTSNCNYNTFQVNSYCCLSFNSLHDIKANIFIMVILSLVLARETYILYNMYIKNILCTLTCIQRKNEVYIKFHPGCQT